MSRVLLLLLFLVIVMQFNVIVFSAYNLNNRVFEYHASYYVIRGSRVSEPFNYRINVTVLRNTSRGVVLRVESTPTTSNPLYSSRSTTPPKTVITYAIEYLKPAGFRINGSYIPFIVSKKFIEYIKHGEIDSIRIEMWGYSAINISSVDVEENRTCINMVFSHSKLNLVTWTQKVKLCYNDDGVLVYMKSNTTRKIGDQSPEHLIYVISLSKSSMTTATQLTMQETLTVNSSRVEEKKAWGYNEAVIAFIAIGLIIVSILIAFSRRK